MKNLVKILLLISSQSLVSGCLYTHKIKAISGLSSQNRESIKSDCGRIVNFGNLTSLREQIYSDTDRILDLTGREKANRYFSEVMLLSDRVHNNILSLMSLLDSDLSVPRWVNRLVWTVLLEANQGLDDVKIQVENVYLNGVSVPHLKKKVQIDRKQDQLKITLDKVDSSLEICELKKAFGIHLKITYGTLIPITTNHRLLLE